MAPVFFSSAADFRAWLEKHHATAKELQVGFYKVGSGRGGLTYAEAVDEALCFGWIDGVVRRIDALSYQHRFSPRTPRSVWSKVNVGKVRRLIRAGRMHAAGLAAFRARSAERTGIYSFERSERPDRFPAAFERKFRTQAAAWRFFQAQPPGYRRTAIFLVLSAKRADTRLRRLARLMADSAAGRRLRELIPSAGKERRNPADRA